MPALPESISEMIALGDQASGATSPRRLGAADLAASSHARRRIEYSQHVSLRARAATPLRT